MLRERVATEESTVAKGILQSLRLLQNDGNLIY